MLTKSTYQDKEALIVTKHGKEQVIQPLLKGYLGLNANCPEGFDTDQFGTFSGSVERQDGPKATVRKKCLTALEKFSKPIGVATEGSFGAHPASPFLPAHEEWMVFMDLERGIEVYERELSTATVQFSRAFSNLNEAKDFLTSISFPDQRIFIHSDEKMNDQANYPSSLQAAHNEIERLFAQYETCWISSDLRAHANPSRMKVIETVAEKLVKRLLSACPNCQTPGYGKEDVKRGLPCAQCNFPTSGVQADIFECKSCGFREELNASTYPKNQDPTYCLICNP